MVKSTRVVSGQLHRARGGKTLIGGKLLKRKVRPPPVVPLPAALPLTEIASKAGPTKNNLDSAATLRTIVSVRKLAPTGRTSAANQRTAPDNFNLTLLDRVASMWGACFKSNNRPRFKLGLHLLLETTTTVNWTDLRSADVHISYFCPVWTHHLSKDMLHVQLSKVDHGGHLLPWVEEFTWSVHRFAIVSKCWYLHIKLHVKHNNLLYRHTAAWFTANYFKNIGTGIVVFLFVCLFFK